MRVVMRIGKGGSIRAIYADGYDFSAHGCQPPTRASDVKPIPSGPLAGWWYVDMSPLGEAYQFCLWPPHPPTRRSAALAEEHQWLVDNWIKEKRDSRT